MQGYPRSRSPFRPILSALVLGLTLSANLVPLSPVLRAQDEADSPDAGGPGSEKYAKEIKQILAAINAHLKKTESPLADKVTVTLDSAAGDTCRALVVPEDPQAADLADAYLRKGADGSWTVLGLGTGFDEEFYKEKKIPSTLQDPVEPDIFLPVKAELLGKVQTALQAGMGEKKLTATEKVSFTDYFSQDSGKAAQLLLTGTEVEVGTAKSLHEKSTKVFTELGWKEDKNYVAEGSSGITSMYRGPDKAFAFFTAVWNASADSGLTEEDDPTLANLKPEQKIYRVEWYVAEPAPGATLSTAPLIEEVKEDAPAPSVPSPVKESALPME